MISLQGSDKGKPFLFKPSYITPTLWLIYESFSLEKFQIYFRAAKTPWSLLLYLLTKSFSTKIDYCIVCQSLERENKQVCEDLEINLCYNIHDADHFFLPDQWGDHNDLWL